MLRCFEWTQSKVKIWNKFIVQKDEKNLRPVSINDFEVQNRWITIGVILAFVFQILSKHLTDAKSILKFLFRRSNSYFNRSLSWTDNNPGWNQAKWINYVCDFTTRYKLSSRHKIIVGLTRGKTTLCCQRNYRDYNVAC